MVKTDLWLHEFFEWCDWTRPGRKGVGCLGTGWTQAQLGGCEKEFRVTWWTAELVLERKNGVGNEIGKDAEDQDQEHTQKSQCGSMCLLEMSHYLLLGRIMVPKRCSPPNLWKLRICDLDGKETWKISLRILWSGNDPGLSRPVQHNHRSLYNWKVEERQGEEEMWPWQQMQQYAFNLSMGWRKWSRP